MFFYSAKSNSDHVTISCFSSFFFQKINFFTVSTHYTAQVRKVNSAKNNFEVNSAKNNFSLTVQKPFQTILGIQFFFQNFLKNLNFSQYASNGKCVEYAKLNTTQNQRKISLIYAKFNAKICKIYAKFNAKYVRSTLSYFALNFGVDLTYLALKFSVDLTYLALNLALILHKFNAFNSNLILR